MMAQEYKMRLKTTVSVMFFLVILLLANCVKIRTVMRKSELDPLWDSLFFGSFGLQVLTLFAMLLSPGIDPDFDEVF